MKRSAYLVIGFLACFFLLFAASPDGLDRHNAEAYEFAIAYPIGWKVEERNLGTGERKMGEVSFMNVRNKSTQKWGFFKVVASERDSTSSPFKGIVDMVGEQGDFREAKLGEEEIKILVDHGKTTWLLCDQSYEDFSYSFSFRVQGKLDADSWAGIRMVLGTFARLE